MTEGADLAAIRMAYDTVADDYSLLLADELDAKPFDRAMLAAFAEVVADPTSALVADLGCGPGRITAHLHTLGLPMVGVDLSPAMIAAARRHHPRLRFEIGAMSQLTFADGALGGIVAWYSIIHTAPDALPTLFQEFHRVLAGEGPLLTAFQVGDTCEHLDHAYGHALSLDVFRHDPERVTDLLGKAGFDIQARLIREPDGRERLPQAFLLARRASPGSPAEGGP